jgi:hypothetical protein
MSSEAKDPKQEKQQHGGSVNPSDPKTNPSPGNQSSNRPQDISKKNPSQDSGTEHQGQEKPEDGKRRAS